MILNITTNTSGSKERERDADADEEEGRREICRRGEGREAAAAGCCCCCKNFAFWPHLKVMQAAVLYI